MAGDVYRATRRAASVAPVPAFVVKMPGAAPGTHVSLPALSLPPGLPVLGPSDGAILVLCPLMDDPAVEATAALIIARCPGAAVERTALTVAQLARMSPLRATWDDTAAPESASRPVR